MGNVRRRDPAPLAEKSIRDPGAARPREGVAEPGGSPSAETERGRTHTRVLCQGATPVPPSVPGRDDHGQGHAAQRDGRGTKEPLPGDGLWSRAR